MATAGAIALAQAFDLPTGVDDLKDAVRNFDFSKLSSRRVEHQEHLNVKLAPSFGTLTKDSIKAMDDGLKVMMVGTVKSLAALKDKSWENVISTCMQNPLIEPMDSGLERSDTYSKSSSGAFKTDGSPNATIVHEVDAWFKNLIKDTEVIDGTGIDINVLGKIVAETGASVDSFEAFFGKHEYQELTMVEIGVLRFPDLEHPHFQVYRIKLTAFRDSRRILFYEENKNGINGEYASRKFQPRESVIQHLKGEVMAKAIDEANNMLG